MFNPQTEEEAGWDTEIKDDVIEECNKHGGVIHIYVDKNSAQGNVYVKCPSIAAAIAAVNALHGRWFAARWRAPGEDTILPLSIAQWDCANASHALPTLPLFRLRFLLELILHSLSFPMNLPYVRQEKISETVTSRHMGQPEVMPCQHQTHLLEARAYCRQLESQTKFHSWDWHRTRPNPFPTPQQNHFSLAIALSPPVCGSHFLGVPEAGKCAEQRSCSHAHCKAHHETHLYSVKAAGLRLPIRAYGHRHLKKKGQYPHRFTALSNRLL
ncbi:RNA-binding protein 39 [Lamprotornis superbus]|uniref:RNA-binding protein 39 n=1 Tax=Lamprotornis superbus TaxID=245042 RepID=A0A835NGU2_9PASS|nr:RNA-binding protein 39 [Lamprotornis superbus]